MDIFLINETKLDESFGKNNFTISDYKFIRKHETKFGLEFLFILIIKIPSDIEILLTLQLTIRKSKILVLGIFKSPNRNETDFNTSFETFISKL